MLGPQIIAIFIGPYSQAKLEQISLFHSQAFAWWLLIPRKPFLPCHLGKLLVFFQDSLQMSSLLSIQPQALSSLFWVA